MIPAVIAPREQAGGNGNQAFDVTEQRDTTASRGIRMQVLTDTKQRMPSSRVLEEVIHQVPAEYVTVGWLTSILHRHSFGIIILCLGLLSTTPIGSTIPGLVLAVMAVQLIMGRGEPAFPHFIMKRRLPTKQLVRLGEHAIYVLKY
ncbi:MAG: exopolysaccharide biosynthesis protein, partial [Alphaproteobacteria bacterium]